MNDQKLEILRLSRNEEIVLKTLQNGPTTPLAISRSTDVSRTTAYSVLQSLHERGMVKSSIEEGKKFWHLAPEQVISDATSQVRQELFADAPAGREIGSVRTDSAVVVYRGAKDIKALIKTMLTEHSQEKLYVMQGNTAAIGWDKIFSIEETNELNTIIKKNDIVVEAFLPPGWFEKQAGQFGRKWAMEFQGRATRANVIPVEYFKHGGQVYVFKDSTYFLALNDELVIEVKNADVQKIILALFDFMQNNSRAIDVNATLRRILGTDETAI